MRSFRIFFSFGIALLIFLGILVSETTYFNLLINNKNPLEKDTNLLQTKKILQPDPQVFFDKKGAFFHFYPESEINFTKNKKEFIAGEGFLSTLGVDTKNFDSKNILFNTGFSVSNFKPKIGQITLGPLMVNYPGGSIFLVRDKDKKISQIYSLDTSVEIFFEGGKTPFILSPMMWVTIYEELINEKTKLLFYSKIKKEFRLRPFVLADIPNKTKDVPSKFYYSIVQQKKWINQIYRFLKNTPYTWIRWKNDSVIHKTIKIIKKVQKNLSFGNLAKKKEKEIFVELVEPFFQAHIAWQNNNINQANKFLQEFKKNFQKQAWNNFLAKNISYQKSWNDFVVLQKFWLQTLDPEDSAQVFAKFWKNFDNLEFTQEIDFVFREIESLISHRYFEKAQKKIIVLKSLLEKINNKEQFFYFTKIRRVLTEIMKKETFFQNQKMFDFYTFLIQKELLAFSDNIFLEEIKLENGQNLLFFLNRLLKTDGDIKISEVLISIYKKLSIPEIAKKLGRDIFSQEEIETIELINFVGDAGISESERIALREYIQKQKSFKANIKSLTQKNPTDSFHNSAQEKPKKDIIHNAPELKKYFATLDIDTKKVRFQAVRNKNNILEKIIFENIKFEEKLITGVFNINTQIFEKLRIDNQKHQNLHIRFLSKILDKIKNEKQKNEDSSQQNNDNQNINKIFQNSMEAIFEREIIRKIFIAEGFSVFRKDITILDKSFNNFEILNAKTPLDFSIDFKYNKKTKLVSNIKIKKDKISDSIPDCPKKDFFENITKKTELLLPKEKN